MLHVMQTIFLLWNIDCLKYLWRKYIRSYNQVSITLNQPEIPDSIVKISSILSYHGHAISTGAHAVYKFMANSYS